MTDAQRHASIKRHARFLTEQQLDELMPSEAELIAAEHLKNQQKRMGVWMMGATFREELNYGSGR